MSRLKRILIKLAQRHAPQLVTVGWEQGRTVEERLAYLTRNLAMYGILLVVGDAPVELKNTKRIHVEDWVQSYARLYHVIAQGVLPSLGHIQAYYADENDPIAVVLEAEAAPILEMIAGYFVPYLAIRQEDQAANAFEMRGLMHVVLTELEADDLKPQTLQSVREAAVEALGNLFNSRIRHVALTNFDAGAAGIIKPSAKPEPTKPIVQPPPGVPEEKSVDPPDVPFDLDTIQQNNDEAFAATEEMFSVNLPLPRSASKRLPPVPSLPEEEDD